MLHTFDQAIQQFPMQSAEHMMISLSEPAGVVNIQRNESMFLIPLDVSIFATSLMGSLYYRLAHKDRIKHIIYIRADVVVPKGQIWTPKATGVKQVLGRTISYNHAALLQGVGREQVLVKNDSYFSKNEFWYTQAHYAAMLEGRTLLPLVFSREFALKEEIRRLSSILPKDSLTTDTIIVIADDLRFRIKENNNSTEISLIKDRHHPRFDMFCGYGDMIGEIPNIVRVEAVEDLGKDSGKVVEKLEKGG